MERHDDIPGATPLDDISGLKIKGVTSRGQLYEYEFRNTLNAVHKYLAARPTQRMAPFNLDWVLQLHEEMFGNVWEWAGKIRRSDTNIGVGWHQVEMSLQNLVDDFAIWGTTEMDNIELSALLHHRAVWIHPFLNGNGRWARLLVNIWLKREGYPIIRWPDADMTDGVSAIRNKYLRAIYAADEGDYQPLIRMHTRYIEGLD